MTRSSSAPSSPRCMRCSTTCSVAWSGRKRARPSSPPLPPPLLPLLLGLLLLPAGGAAAAASRRGSRSSRACSCASGTLRSAALNSCILGRSRSRASRGSMLPARHLGKGHQLRSCGAVQHTVSPPRTRTQATALGPQLHRQRTCCCRQAALHGRQVLLWHPLLLPHCLLRLLRLNGLLEQPPHPAAAAGAAAALLPRPAGGACRRRLSRRGEGRGSE